MLYSGNIEKTHVFTPLDDVQAESINGGNPSEYYAKIDPNQGHLSEILDPLGNEWDAKSSLLGKHLAKIGMVE